jgi:hypothetical protein
LRSIISHQKAGLPVSAEDMALLYRPRRQRGGSDDDNDDGNDGGDGVELIPGTTTPVIPSFGSSSKATSTSTSTSTLPAPIGKSRKRKREEAKRAKTRQVWREGGGRGLFGRDERDSDDEERELKRMSIVKEYEARKHASDDEYESDDLVHTAKRPKTSKPTGTATVEASITDVQASSDESSGSDDEEDDDEDDALEMGQEAATPTSTAALDGIAVARIGDTVLRAAAGPAVTDKVDLRYVWSHVSDQCLTRGCLVLVAQESGHHHTPSTYRGATQESADCNGGATDHGGSMSE